MTRPPLWQFVTTRLAAACRLPLRRMTPQTPLLDLELDSLTLVSVLTQVEAAYELALTPNETLALLEADTLAEFVCRLRRYIGLRSTPSPLDRSSRSSPKNET